MAETILKSKVDVDIKVHLILSLEEAKVLSIMTLWGADAFYKVFTEHLGKQDLERSKDGLYSLFETIKSNLPSRLSEAENIVKVANTLKK